MSLDEILDVTRADPTLQELQCLISLIHDGRWADDSDELRPYKQVFQELSTCGEIILCGTQIVIPQLHQQRVIDLAHGRSPRNSEDEDLRSKVYFPSIDHMAEQTV